MAGLSINREFADILGALMIPLATKFEVRDVATLTKLLGNEAGATAIECSMVSSLVSVVAVFVITKIGDGVATHFESVANAL